MNVDRKSVEKEEVAGSPTTRLPGEGEGRVLRVKEGYNPNSSSVGSMIPVFVTLSLAAGAVTILLLNLLGPVGDLLRSRRAPAGEKRPATERREQSGE